VVKLIVGLAALALTSQVSLLAKPSFASQTPPERGILRSAAMKIENVEPDWRFVSGICNFRGPVSNEQVGVECGSWVPRSAVVFPAFDLSVNVGVRLHIVSSEDDAAREFDRQKREGSRADGWTFADYDLADGARIGTYMDGRFFNIDVRKGRLLMNVGALTKSDVERFAKYLVAAISD
jgi:hypothetical protein